MSTEDKKTDNELIAEFMGLERSAAIWDKDEHAYTIKLQGSPHWNSWTIPSEMLFHKSWDWLMPVVEKIGDMWSPPDDEGDSAELAIQADHVASLPIASHSQQVYKAVVEFIRFYNTQPK